MSNTKFPLQSMIASVVQNATTKLAEDEDAARSAMSDKNSCEECGRDEKNCICKDNESSGADGGGGPPPNLSKEAQELSDPEYVTKVAAALDFIADNVDNIEPTQRGVLGNILAKQAGKSDMPQNSAGSLETEQAMEGKQQYKHDKAQGAEASESQANSPLSTAERAGGKTQLENNMHDAPGGGSVAPTGKYPEQGPLKTAGLTDILAKAKGHAQRGGELLAGGKAPINTKIKNRHLGGSYDDAKNWETAVEHTKGPRPGNQVGNLTARTSDGSEARKSLAARGIAGAGIGAGAAGAAALGGEKTAAGEVARQAILSKLAGEDVMPAKVSAKKSGGPSPGDGELSVHSADSVPKTPNDGLSGYGNQARKHLSSIDSIINMTKGEAKGVQKPQLAEVLDEPAFSSKHDSKLRENLRNSGKAGVKIAGANPRDLIEKIASQGCECEGAGSCTHCRLTEKVAMYAGGSASGYSGDAPTPPDPAGGKMAGEDGAPNGCQCGGQGSCRVCRLNAAQAGA